jgi:RNA polymerase sigma factor (sigma-70 family)
MKSLANKETEEKVSEPGDDLIELIRKCGEGDQESLNHFFERYSNDIYNFPIKVFHLDEDAASEFFLYSYERLREGNRFRSFQGRSSFRTWFYTVLRNLVIDWMRTIREVQTVNFSRSDERGNEYRMIENTPDPRTVVSNEDVHIGLFKNNLKKLNIELRVVFKLSYIYYLDLDREEVDYLCDRSGRSKDGVYQYLAELKHRLSEKELKNIEAEDKITSLYTTIIELKNRKDRILVEDEKTSSGPVTNPGIYEVERLSRTLDKKYQQREKLLDKRDRGHFIVRTPYKYISELLKIPEGSISVQMMRSVEKIRGNMIDIS